MSTVTLILYLTFATLWVVAMRRDGGIGLGVRFAFTVNTALVLLVGPLMIATLGSGDLTPALNQATDLTLCGLLAFVVFGYFVYPPLIGRRTVLPPGFGAALTAPKRVGSQHKVACWLIGLGLVAEVGTPFAYSVPTLRAVWGQVTALQNVGLIMLALNAAVTRNSRLLAITLAVASGIGLLKASLSGHFGGILFIGVFLVCLGCFAFEFRWSQLTVFVPTLAVGLYLYFAWMSGRAELRTAINQDVGLANRLTMTADIFTSPRFVIADQNDFIDQYRERGDFSDLMAAAITHTPTVEPYAMGETFEDAFIAIVPRALWPDKPYTAGGNAFVTKYTGVRFGESTSVGMNLLFEFYVNFGPIGVICGMSLLGLLAAWLDNLYARRGARSLRVEWTLALCLLVIVSVDTVALMAMSLLAVVVIGWAVPPVLRAVGGPDLTRVAIRIPLPTSGLR